MFKTSLRRFVVVKSNCDEAIVKAYHVIGQGSRCGARSTTLPARHEICTDTPKNAGGCDTAAEPVETLLAALIGCEQATAHFVGRMMGIRLKSINFELHAERDARGSMHTPVTEEAPVTSQLTSITGSAKCLVSSKSRRGSTQQEIHELGTIVHNRCPIATMVVNSGCTLEIDWILLGTDNNE